MKEYKRFFIIFFVLFAASYIFISLSQTKSSTNSEKEYKIYSLKFDDLPEDEKEKYISKEQLYEYGGYITAKSYIKDFDVVFDENLTNDTLKLKAELKNVIEKNRILIKDNVDIAEKNLELISKIENIKSQMLSEKQQIQSQNLKNFKEQEKRHEESIKNLTNNLNQAEKQGINTIKKYEKKIVQLERNISTLISKYDKNISNIIMQKDLNISKLQNNNFKLRNKIALLNENNISKENIKTELKNLKNEIKVDKNEIEKINFLHKKEIKRIKDGFDVQRITLEDELSKKSNLIIDLKTEIKNLKYDIKNK